MPTGVYQRNNLSLEERFWSKVLKGPGCWGWSAGHSDKGYAQISLREKNGGHSGYAHRVSYELAKGPIPNGLEIDHLCRNRGCVNPEHLEAVTRRVNCLRGESIASKNARKTHCVNGHELAGDNLRQNKRGGRACRKCAAIRMAARNKSLFARIRHLERQVLTLKAKLERRP